MSLGYKLLLLSCTCVYPRAMKIPETIQEKIDNLDYIKKKLKITHGKKTTATAT